jgi:prevent-host-death family protein
MEIRIAALKARLSAVLRRVSAGESIVVLDRERPIARLIPHDGAGRLSVRGPVAGAPAPGAVPLPRARKLRRDVLAYLAEERQSHR